MFFFRMRLYLGIHNVLLISIIFVCGCSALVAGSRYENILPNSNQNPAGRLIEGKLTIRMEAVMGEWYPEENDGPGLPVAAFREEGGRPSTPGPLIRVIEGTEIYTTVHNRLDHPLTMHGLHTRPGNEKDVLVIPPGESREVNFFAGAPGTYFYWASQNEAESVAERRAEDGQLDGVMIVDPKDADPRADAAKLKADRILVITGWLVVDDETTKPPKYREVLGINGLSWPHTERLTYHVGEIVRWRVINASVANHPMHLHGFYFRVDSVGDAESDTIYGEEQRRMAVTELLRPGRTFALTWIPDRSGNWVFHCHVLPHISPERRYWRSTAMSSGHETADHAREGMAGLVTGITVLPTAKRVRVSAKSKMLTRKVELVATEMINVFGKDPGMAFAIANKGSALHPTIPGPPLILTQGERTAIRVVNRLPEPLTVHWHGIELESYYDGVAGVSGSGDHLMLPIASGKSFVAEMTPPRAGTFIYHTHIDDIKQLSSGLYGPLIVLPAGQNFDPETDRVLIISRAGPGETPIWLNGSRSPNIGSLKAGQKYRLRIINIVPENPPINVGLDLGDRPATWRPVAKDGAELPAGQRELCPAKLTIGVGETYDFEFSPEQSGELAFHVVRPANRFPAEITPSHRIVELRPESKVVVKVPILK
jgi:FtsP/CotA-like multicopper oxidase with cupredoxin domain